VEAVVARVLASRRYRTLAPALVRRLTLEELPKARNDADAEKRVKRRLHQIFGAYATRLGYQGILTALRQAADSGDPAALRDACRAAMAGHASTRERLPLIERFYDAIFSVTGPPASLLDTGCGLNPLAAPWMRLPAGCEYLAVDIDLELVEFLNAALPLLGVGGRAEPIDVVDTPPAGHFDVALLLKAVPCLDQQRPGIAAGLLASIHATWFVVSYPTRSLGGHGKGMARTYRASFEAIADHLQRPFTPLEFPGELVFVLPGGGSSSPTQRESP